MLQRIKKGFTLVELLVVVSVIGVLATMASGYFTEKQQKARDMTRYAAAETLEATVESFLESTGGVPKAGSSGTWADAFDLITGLDTTTYDFGEDPFCSTNQKDISSSGRENKFWKRFFHNTSMSEKEAKKSYKKYVEKFHDKNNTNGGFLYKGIIIDGEFKYQIAIPTELDNIKASKDGGLVGSRAIEKGTLVGMEGFELTKDDLGDCFGPDIYSAEGTSTFGS